jgi:hypothetical protein
LDNWHSSPAFGVNGNVTVRWPPASRFGIALLLFGITWFGGWICWDATRSWVPLNVPVSLSPGHIRTPAFKINIESFYQIKIEVRRDFDPWGIPCLIGGDHCEDSPGVLGVSWSLLSGGRAVASGSSNGSAKTVDLKATIGRIVGGFEAGKGVYVLELDVVRDGSRLNGGAPQLVVFEAGDAHWISNDQGSIVFALSLVLVIGGTYLIIRSAAARRPEKQAVARSYSLFQPEPQIRDLPMDRESRVSQVVRRCVQPSASACVATVLILAGIAAHAYIHHWVATYNPVALHMPVSLAPGHLRSGPIRMNSGEYYDVSIETDHVRPPSAACSPETVLKTRWILYRNGKVADISGQAVAGAGFLGGFETESGFYDLDLEVLTDASCLNTAKPRLQIAAFTNSSSSLTSALLWLCVLLIGAGGILLGMAGVDQFRKSPSPVTTGIGNETRGGHFRWKRRPPTMPRPFFGVSYFGLIAVLVYLVILITVWVLQSWAYRVSEGLRVHLLRSGIATQRDPGIQPLLVRVAPAGGHKTPSPYVDSRPVSWEDLGAVLQKEISQRPLNWPVYFEGGLDMEWRWAARAMDIIQGLGAEVILLTPSSRQVRSLKTISDSEDSLRHGRR